ncbi:hypothetical protein D7B24_008053 [Verticillium nonalfalfae]|uniref:Uncharacterized protein n=1 Tax=Verticillium nonalfalfae TaxID=1051616 RepID=A0A3M9YIG6_9PEZI|nr:uncharacterized protein D7B24_008053 [Verticillium nonalfalfae]RNJ60363.1 hypothetical protein D7B24_008053 [Verticillium nonalfalfae]
MEIPKFRRKPKAPTIATDPKTLTVPDAAEPSPTSNTIPLAVSATTPGKQGSFRKSALRHLRSSAKRARSPAPPPPPPPASSSPPPTLASTRDGLADAMPASPVSLRHRDGLLADSPERNKLKMPSFLDLSQEGIHSKFQDLTWTERNRLHNAMAQEAATNPDSTYRYAVHKQVDMRRGVMDRYCNIKPYNRNRVRLRVPEGTLDYVNASAVVLPSPRRSLASPAPAPAPAPLRYIAMQGPVENSVDSVWRMIAEQFDSPVVIVQLTTMFENGTIKCYPYFPMSAEDEPWILNEDDGWEDGWGAELRFDSMETLEDGAIELRKLILRVAPPPPSAAPGTDADADDADIEVTQTASPAPEPTEQVIWHFLYTRWPDFGAPALEDLGSFLTLMRLSRDYNTGSSTVSLSDADSTLAAPAATSAGPPPRIIHCSAGVGRTGTFITLEHLMRELDAGLLEAYPAAGPDLIHATVEALREQRPSMVQAPPQFLFLYSVLRRMWLERYAPALAAAEGGAGASTTSRDSTDGTASTAGDGEPAAKRLEMGDPFVD